MNLNELKKEKTKKIISSHLNKKKKENQVYLDKKYLDELDINNINNNYTKQELKKINEENYQIIKDNRLIQKATFDFTEMEMKCLNYTISKLKPNELITENDYIEYSLNDLIKIFNIKNQGSQYELIKQSLHNLRTKGKWVKIENEKEKKEKDLSFFRECEIDTTNKNNYIVRVQFMKEILIYLQNLKDKFTPQYLVYTLKLKGKYAIRLYELCKSYQNNYIDDKEIYGFNFYIDKMRVKWCLPTNYLNGEIKRILDKAMKEINKKTDIKISIYNAHKDGKKIDYYIIKIEPNQAQVIENNKKESEKNECN